MPESQAIINFHGDQILTVRTENGIYIPMKPIVKNMGLDWKTQLEKIQKDTRYGHMPIPLQTASGVQNMVCMPLKKINGWLFSVNYNKVRKDLKGKIEQYQEECFHALHKYWFGKKQEHRPVTLPDFTNPAEAAEAWAKQFREKEKAQLELKEAQPQIAFAKAIQESNDAISIGEFAKILNKNGYEIGQNRLFEKFRELKLIYLRGGKNVPYQTAIEAGWLKFDEFNKKIILTETKEVVDKLCTKITITGKGQVYVEGKLRKEREDRLARDKFFKDHPTDAPGPHNPPPNLPRQMG